MGQSCYRCHGQLSRTCIPNLSCDYFSQSCLAKGKMTLAVILLELLCQNTARVRVILLELFCLIRQNSHNTRMYVVHHNSPHFPVSKMSRNFTSVKFSNELQPDDALKWNSSAQWPFFKFGACCCVIFQLSAMELQQMLQLEAILYALRRQDKFQLVLIYFMLKVS